MVSARFIEHSAFCGPCVVPSFLCSLDFLLTSLMFHYYEQNPFDFMAVMSTMVGIRTRVFLFERHYATEAGFVS